jgi:hypothetical protein
MTYAPPDGFFAAVFTSKMSAFTSTTPM